jgi:Fic family protein
MSDKMSDKKLVKKVMTFKSGNFVFSRKFDEGLILPKLSRADALYESIQLLPILPGYASQLEEELIRKSIHGTAAIEGNPLKEEEVEEVLAGKKGRFPARSEKEVENLKTAYALVTHSARHGSSFVPLPEETIKTTHYFTTKGLDYPLNEPGAYRHSEVKVGDKAHGGVYRPPRMRKDIQDLMSGFISWINEEEMREVHPALRAALAHYHVACIHPFGDGNGRTARLLETLLMTWSGIEYVPKMLSNYYYKNMDDYFIVFRESQKNKNHDITPFLNFFVNGLLSSLKELQEKIISQLRPLTLKDHFETLRQTNKITQRQHDLLKMLLSWGASFTLRDLASKSPFDVIYRDVTERTARRDVDRLMSLKCLGMSNTGYVLNTRMLG